MCCSKNGVPCRIRNKREFLEPINEHSDLKLKQHNANYFPYSIKNAVQRTSSFFVVCAGNGLNCYCEKYGHGSEKQEIFRVLEKYSGRFYQMARKQAVVSSSSESYTTIFQCNAEKSFYILKNVLNAYTLLYGLTYNTRGYFESFVVFFRAPEGGGNIRAKSKMSACIIC